MRGPILNLAESINWANKLNDGLASRWQAMPYGVGGSGSTVYRDWVRKSANTGTLTNGPTWAGAMGRNGGYGSLKFDTSATMMVTHTRPAFTAISAFSVSCWIRFPASPVDASDSYFGKWDDPTATVQHFARWLGGLQWFVRDSADANQAGATIDAANIKLLEWNFCCGVADGTNVNLYVINRSGFFSNAAALTGPYIPSDTATWRIGWGRTNAGGHNHDCHCYFNRALSASEVAALFAAQSRFDDPTLNWIEPRVYSFPTGAAPETPAPENIMWIAA